MTGHLPPAGFLVPQQMCLNDVSAIPSVHIGGQRVAVRVTVDLAGSRSVLRYLLWRPTKSQPL